jgi:tRNA(Ile)-lysidine synthase
LEPNLRDRRGWNLSGPLRLRHRVLAAIRQERLWMANDRVAVAVSGGVDSVVLLDVLVQTRQAHGATLSVVTVDHGTRPESAEDARFVQDLAAGLGLKCVAAAVSLGEGASEARCREARYAVFAGLAVDQVALAHHRDDQAETLLLSLVRGAGAGGLAGMPWRRDRFVRPLLAESRVEILRYAQARGLAWREDASNLDMRHLRNRIRSQVIPLLEEIRPGASETLARAARTLGQDENVLRDLAAPLGAGPWLRGALAAAAPALARRAVLRAIPGATASLVDEVLQASQGPPGTYTLAGGVTVSIDEQHVSLMVPARGSG